MQNSGLQAKNPATVYLDSSDISRLSSPDYRGLRDELLALKARGYARYPFSDVLIFECLPIEFDQANLGLERIKTIAELSGLESHPSAWSILDYEILNMVASQRKSRSRPKLATDWFYSLPEMPVLWDIVRKHSMGESRITRGTRNARRIKYKEAVKSFRRAECSASEEALLSEIFESFPYRSNDRARILSAMKTGTTSADINRIRREALADIVNFADWVVRSGERSKALVDELREKGRNIEAMYVALYESSRSGNAAAPVDSPEGKQTPEGPQWLQDVPRLMAASLLGRSPVEFAWLPPLSAEATPALYTYHQFMIKILDGVRQQTKPRNPNGRVSHDYFDALHAIFLPSVDIFRADKHSATILKALSATTIVANSLAEIPSLVEQHQHRA